MAKAKTTAKAPAKKVQAKTAAAKKTAVKADKAAPKAKAGRPAKAVKAAKAGRPAKAVKSVSAVKAKAGRGRPAKSASAGKAPAQLKFASLRKAYGEALVEAGRNNKDVVALEADLGKSTMSIMFKEAFPDRYFEMGIAEQGMTSTAAGLALAGKTPFAGTFAVFAAGRAYDQIRCSIAIPQANVKICGSSCGLSDYGDGKTHQSVEDANIIRAMPKMTVLNPVDAEEVKKMIPAMIKYKGPVYIRINRNDLPVFTSPKGEYKIGKIYPITEGKDAAIFATGVMVSKAVEAAEKLKARGVSVQVLNVSTLKPLSKKEVLKYAAGKKAVIVAEESVRTGGLGETVGAMLAGESNAKFEIVAIDDKFGSSAHGYEDLLKKYGLSSDHVYKAALKALGIK